MIGIDSSLHLHMTFAWNFLDNTSTIKSSNSKKMEEKIFIPNPNLSAQEQAQWLNDKYITTTLLFLKDLKYIDEDDTSLPFDEVDRSLTLDEDDRSLTFGESTSLTFDEDEFDEVKWISDLIDKYIAFNDTPHPDDIEELKQFMLDNHNQKICVTESPNSESSNSKQTEEENLNARLMQKWLVRFGDLPLHDIIELVTPLPNDISLAEFLIRKKMLTYGRWADMKKNWKCGEDVQGDTDNVIVSGLWNKKRVYFKEKKLSKNFVKHANKIGDPLRRRRLYVPFRSIRVDDLPSYHPKRVKLRMERLCESGALNQPNSLEREALNQPKNKSSRGCGIS